MWNKSKIAYLDCSSGISGDMFLGSLVNAGLSLSHLKKELSKLPLHGYAISSRRVKRGGISATKVDVALKSTRSSKVRKFEDIRKIITSSRLSGTIIEKGISLFQDLFAVEGKVHGKKVSNTHLHELGGVDCMVDIFGTLIGLEYLKIDALYSSPLNVGTGFVSSDHGALPVPAPATLGLLTGMDIYSKGPEAELTTPTGALLASRLAGKTGPIPFMNVQTTGYGAGNKDFPGWPNLLRLVIGEGSDSTTQDEIIFAETNIDDMNPQYFDHVMDLLFEEGALDVYLTPVQMKKNRPAVKISVLVKKELLHRIVSIILSETTSLGVRFTGYNRYILKRETLKIRTSLGTVRFKRVFQLDGKQSLYPEYDDCSTIARKTGIPLRRIREQLIHEARKGL